MSRRSLFVLYVICIFLAVFPLVTYSRLSLEKRQIQAAWEEIESGYAQISELSPLLIEAVKGKIDDPDLFQSLNLARANFVNSQGVADKLYASQELQKAFDKAFISIKEEGLEKTPKVDALHEKISMKIEEIIQAKTAYNQVVNYYNLHIGTFPTSVIADFFGYYPYPKIEMQTNPQP